jgi:hypothetical protein
MSSKKSKPWLAPLLIDDELRALLESTWDKQAKALGVRLPKSVFVRMLLGHGCRAFVATLEDPLPGTYIAKRAKRSRRSA